MNKMHFTLTRCICSLANPNFRRGLYTKYPFFVSRYESTSTQPQVKEEKFDFEDIVVTERAERRKPPIPPFMKDAMVSIFNRDLLAYPEILNKEEATALNERVTILDSVFKNINRTTEDKRLILKQSKLYGAPIKLTEGGLAMNVTERIRYIETLSTDLMLTKSLSDHWVGLSSLQKGLKDNQFQQLTPDLISGDKIVSLCMREQISSRIAQPDFRTAAKPDKNGIWCISGEKLCHDASGYQLVLCAVEATRIKAFLVHPNAEGVTYSKPYIVYRDTPGTPLDEATEIALGSILGLTRLDTAVLSYSILKQIVLEAIDFVRGKFISGKPLAELPHIRGKIGEALVTFYAAESMAYFVAGLLDGYYEPDADIEVAMCRAFIVKHGLNSIMELLTIPGLESANDNWSHYLDEFRKLSLHDEVNDSVNMFIALSGLQHAGKAMMTEVKQLRNPLFYPSFVFKKIFADRHQVADDPKLTLHLGEHLHPSMQQSAENLEYSVLRLRYASETLLTRHGMEINKAVLECERLAQAASEVLAMTAVLARASRSYCIGMRNSEIEMRIAMTYTEIAKKRVKELILEIDHGEYVNLDNFKSEFGRKILDLGGVLVEKPTERVFW